jgi:hypothetical protein
MSALPYPLDLRGYGRQPPHAQWSGQARVAVQFVLNYEESGENNPLHGDPASETFLSELVTAQAYENHHMTMESMYEHGSRVGVWRIGSLQRFLDHIGRHERVWICRRIDIARRWRAVHPSDASTALTWPIGATSS